MLFEKWGEHPILTVVDPAIFSGMIIRFGYQVIDLSGKHQLKKLASHLEN
jgi:F0F1-type ATP synthase delta subunit